MDAKPHPKTPSPPPETVADRAAEDAATEPEAQALAADSLPEPERIERQNDLA